MSWIFVIISICFSALLVGVAKFLFAKIFKNTINEEQDKLVKSTKESLETLRNMLDESSEKASKLQLNAITTQLNDVQALLHTEKEKLSTIEVGLKAARKKMEEKEILQQELKTSKEEDEKELTELLDSYEKNSNESRELEKVLAEQIKVLDDHSKSTSIPDVQRDFLLSLNETLEESGSNLRNVITEYEQMFERLSSLRQQLSDLEMEYSKLIESKLANS